MYIFHDLDGASHACTHIPPRQQTGWLGDWTPITVPGAYPGLISTELIEALNVFASNENIENIWLTSWEEDAPNLYAPSVGLNAEHWKVLYGVEYDSQHAWWKLDALKEFFTIYPLEPFIWIDDEISENAPAMQWIQTLPIEPLIISPETAYGLTREHIQQMHTYVDLHS